jgi:hypothetical protein
MMRECIADGVSFFFLSVFGFDELHVACFDDFFVCLFDTCMYVVYVNGWIS